MKKSLIPLLMLSLLVGCTDLNTSSHPSNEPSISDSSDPSSESPSTEDPSEDSSIEVPPSSEIPPSSETPSESEPPNEGEHQYSISLNSSTSFRISNYNTGNYGSFSNKNSNGKNDTYEYYRAVKFYSGLIKLLPYNLNINDTSAHGAFYNTSPIYDISKIELSYLTSKTNGESPLLKVGKTRLDMKIHELPLSSSNNTITIETNLMNYFSIETNDSILSINSINIYYSSIQHGAEHEYGNPNENLFRINPIVYEGSVTDGSTVEVPTKVVRNKDSYTIEESKTYTYYSLQYIQRNPQLADEAAYTDITSLAQYYTAFKEWPPNFVQKKTNPLGNWDAVEDIFGNNTRFVSTYSRTDGYALAVPYKTKPNTEKPIYHELDIDVSGTYSENNRGVGRLVVWEYGFDTTKGAIGYDNAPTAVYTDDHYATFQEYLNTGTFGPRFNSEMSRTPYIWGLATTIAA